MTRPTHRAAICAKLTVLSVRHSYPNNVRIGTGANNQWGMRAKATMKPSDPDERINLLFENHYGEVLAYCTRRIGSTHADDAAVDVFAIAWRRLDEIDWETVRPWLYGIARGVLANRVRSSVRQSRLSQRLSGLVTAPPETPDIYLVRREADNEVLTALTSLKPNDQEVLRLAAWEELSAPEIARVLNISTSAAEQRLHRAKHRLAAAVGPRRDQTTIHPPATEEGGR